MTLTLPQSSYLPTTNEPLLPEFWPQIDNLVTEDDTPMDNIFSEKQQRLLTESLYTSWSDCSFIALANVGLFYAVKQPPLVPDVLVSLDVTLPEDLWEKSHRSYFMWEYGKVPEVVIEIVSNRVGQEADEKLTKYATIGIPYYVIFDPKQHLSNQILRLYKLHDTGYLESIERWLPKVQLGLCLWDGTYENQDSTWLRWCDRNNQLILTGAERATQAEQRAIQAEQRAEQLTAYLRSQGIDPENF